MRYCLSLLLAASLLVACSSATPPATLPAGQEPESYRSLVIDDELNQWWHKAIFYEIWPRSFYDADGDGSGDFKGMTAKLDYLKDLGVNGIWLTPIFEAPSYHGYDFQDFYAVESDYGTMADFEEFVRESHARGIKVILDLVLNHISDKHEWFIKSANKVPGYEDYFIWRDDLPEGWGPPWSSESRPEAVWHWSETRRAYYYGAFGSTQPDVNLTKQAVVDELNNLAGFWLEKGVDGFRLDAVRYAVEEGAYPGQADTQSTMDYWTLFTQHVKSIKPDAMLVAEAWTDLKTVGRYRNDGKGLDSAFDFDFGNVVIDILNPKIKRTADFGTVSNTRMLQSRENLWTNLQQRKAAGPMTYFSPFLTNHDQNRIMHSLENNRVKAKIAASLLMTSPGTLYLYYGEEIGLSQYKIGDDQYRRAIMQWSEDASAGFNTTGQFWLDQSQWFPWVSDHKGWWAGYWKTLQGKGLSVEAQAADTESLYSHYKRLIHLRKQIPALQLPEEIRYYPVDNKDIWLVENLHGGKSTWVLVNLNASRRATFRVPIPLQGAHQDKLTGNHIMLEKKVSLTPGQTLIL